jgi:nucleotide-binding universal stress UspA family protein
MKSVLASLTGMSGDNATLKAAALVAKSHGAHVDALHVSMSLRTIQEAVGSYAATTPANLAALANEIVHEEQKRCRQARTAFDEVAIRYNLSNRPGPEAGVPSASFVQVDGMGMDETVKRSRYFDLTVMAREHMLLDSRIPDVLIGSGRPILVPPPNPHDTLGTNIAIAWKPSPQAARAVSLAAPFLAKTSRVTLVVAPELRQTQADAIALAKTLQEALVWHGLQAHIVAAEHALDASAALRETVYALEADLLVMGGYGHSRAREFILGGVTRSLLKECDVALFLSH